MKHHTEDAKERHDADTNKPHQHWDCPAAGIIRDEKVKSKTEGMTEGMARWQNWNGRGI